MNKMIAKIVGVRKVSFTSKEDGKPVKFLELHMLTETDDNDFIGLSTSVVRTSKFDAGDIPVPADYHLNYEPSRSGKAILTSIEPL